MWSIRFFELFYFAPRQRWNNASSLFSAALSGISQIHLPFCKTSWELGWWAWDLWLHFIFAFQVKLLQTLLSTRTAARSTAASRGDPAEGRAQSCCHPRCSWSAAQAWAGLYTRCELTSCSWLGQSKNLCVGGVESWEVWLAGGMRLELTGSTDVALEAICGLGSCCANCCTNRTTALTPKRFNLQVIFAGVKKGWSNNQK